MEFFFPTAANLYLMSLKKLRHSSVTQNIYKSLSIKVFFILINIILFILLTNIHIKGTVL